MGTKKPFFYSSEFWLTALTTIASVAGVVTGIVTGPVGLVVGAIGTAAYSISRGLTKSAGK